MGSLSKFVFTFLGIDKRHATVSLREADLNVDTNIIGFPRFSIQFHASRFVGGVDTMTPGCAFLLANQFFGLVHMEFVALTLGRQIRCAPPVLAR